MITLQILTNWPPWRYIYFHDWPLTAAVGSTKTLNKSVY